MGTPTGAGKPPIMGISKHPMTGANRVAGQLPPNGGVPIQLQPSQPRVTRPMTGANRVAPANRVVGQPPQNGGVPISPPQRSGLQNGQGQSTQIGPTGQFQQNRRIQESERWEGSNYQPFRNYRSEWHDRDWWRSHHSRIVFGTGGWYYWNAGYWLPAWGYDPEAHYAYDGPIYAYNDLPPDQVVSNAQAALQPQGYYQAEADGLLGPLTRSAIVNYQRDHGLYETSTIDRPTSQSLGMK